MFFYYLILFHFFSSFFSVFYMLNILYCLFLSYLSYFFIFVFHFSCFYFNRNRADRPWRPPAKKANHTSKFRPSHHLSAPFMRRKQHMIFFSHFLNLISLAFFLGNFLKKSSKKHPKTYQNTP